MPAFAGTKDTGSCTAGQARIGGFAYGLNIDEWKGFAALGYHAKLCLPTPNNAGLVMNATVGDASLTSAGGYAMTTDLTNAPNDVNALRSMVGWGNANVATQYGGALCASIGSLAAAKRSCGVGIAFTDVNQNIDGTASQRGVPVSAAQAGVISNNVPFGRKAGFGQYGEASNDMESYANHILHKHATKTVPSAPSGIDAWNNANSSAPFSFTGTDFTSVTLTASPNAATLAANINRSVTAPLNLAPVDGVATSPLDPDMSQSLPMAYGDLYALSLPALAANQSPLYGSGAGRWFFHNPSDALAASKPLMDVSSIYQGSTYLLTGRLSGLPTTNPTLSNAYVSQLTQRYADLRPNPAGTLYIDHAGQFPTAVTSDADMDARLAAALRLERPLPNIGGGEYHSCAITSAGGAVSCWGDNGAGELGDNQPPALTPRDVPGASTGVTNLASGPNQTCATAGGVLKCWGRNLNGEIGDGTRIDRHVPATVSGISTGTVAGTYGYRHACAVTSTGGVKCWGHNDRGQLGTGNTASALSPASVTGLSSGVAAVATGDVHTCALTTAGAVYCWGGNESGQLGTGTTTTSNVPVLVMAAGSAAALTTTVGGACIATPTGAVKCWGWNGAGQVGDGTTVNRLVPTQVTGLTSGVTSGVNAISGGLYHACAIQSGAAKCWGQNGDGQVGRGSSGGTYLTPQPVAGGLSAGVVALSQGLGTHTCGRLSSGAISCWGNNTFGQIGDGTTTARATPVTVANLPTAGVTAIATGGHHTCATVNGAVKCWGRNNYGQLGLVTDRNAPVAAYGLSSGVVSIVGGYMYSCALKSSGAVACWGNNNSGSLGNGNTKDSPVPLTVPGLPPIAQLTSGGLHVCAITKTGAAKCWGYGQQGQLGDGLSAHNGGQNYSWSPVDVTGLSSGVIQVAAGPQGVSTCALTAAGAVKCWGQSLYGNLGGASGTDPNTPRDVPSLTSGVVSIAVGGYHACAVTQAGAVKCWGHNGFGQVGDPAVSGSNQTTPRSVPSLSSGVIAVSAGAFHTCAIVAGGTVKCWGQNTYKQAGGSTQFDAPTTVALPSPAVSLHAAVYHTCARLANGNVSCWGSNFYGQLGSGNNNDSSAPVAVSGSVSNASLIASQASVLVNQTALGGAVAGHITPIPWSMTNKATGHQALIATYDPLAAAAAMFIEQYDAHVAACTATSGETDIVEDDGGTNTNGQKQGKRLWACSNATGKTEFLSGMQVLLNGARHYLFGSDGGCIKSTETVAGAACPVTTTGPDAVHFPYTFHVPAYTSTTYNAAYYTQVNSALASYRTAIEAAPISRLAKTLQFAGAAQFTRQNNAIVTSRVTRSGSYGTECIVGDGFTWQ